MTIAVDTLNPLERELLALRALAVRDAKIICALMGHFKVEEVSLSVADVGGPGPVGFQCKGDPDRDPVFIVSWYKGDVAQGLIESQDATQQ